MSDDVYKKSVAYNTEKGKFEIAHSVFSSVLVLTLVLFGLLGKADTALKSFALPQYLHGIIYILAVLLFFTLINLPWSLYNLFVIEKRYGFTKMSIALFFLDKAKSLIISALLVSFCYGVLSCCQLFVSCGDSPHF
jgi:STE24 endopeptidase